MIKKTVSILMIFSLCNICTAQQIEKSQNSFFISISPFSLVDFADGSSVRLSIESKFFNRISLSVESGFYTSLANGFAYKNDPKGLLVKPCVKYYLQKGNVFNQGKYIGIEYQYKQQAYSLEDSIAINHDFIFNKNYEMKRYVNCINLKYGQFNSISNLLTMEWFAGIGIRSLKSNSNLSDTEYASIITSEENHNSTGIGSSVREIGSNIYLNITVGLKIGIKI